VKEVDLLLEHASPTAHTVLQEQLLREEKRRVRVTNIVVNRAHVRARIGLLGGSLIAAVRLGVDETTLRRCIEAGQLNAMFIGG
jgi:hypothetical protein